MKMLHHVTEELWRHFSCKHCLAIGLSSVSLNLSDLHFNVVINIFNFFFYIMDKKQTYKYCIVPCCRNATANTSGKPFFRVSKHVVKQLYDKNGNGIQWLLHSTCGKIFTIINFQSEFLFSKSLSWLQIATF